MRTIAHMVLSMPLNNTWSICALYCRLSPGCRNEPSSFQLTVGNESVPQSVRCSDVTNWWKFAFVVTHDPSNPSVNWPVTNMTHDPHDPWPITYELWLLPIVCTVGSMLGNPIVIPSTLPLPVGSLDPNIIHSCLGPPESISQMPFLHGSRSLQTDRPRYSVYSNRPHLASAVMLPNKNWLRGNLLS